MCSVCSAAAEEHPCRAEDESLFRSSINLQVRGSISVDVGNAVLRNVTIFCRCQTITAKYLLLLFVCERATSRLRLKGRRADGVSMKGQRAAAGTNVNTHHFFW